MGKVMMLTVVPINLAEQLVKEKRIQNYNTLPQLNEALLPLIQEIMVEKIGYPNIPMACLKSARTKGDLITTDAMDVLSVLPANSKNSVLFQLEMPEDMVLTGSFSELLEISAEASELDTADDYDLDYLKEKLEELLSLGCGNDVKDPICFIPFLDSSKCTFYSQFDSEFKTKNLDLPGIRQLDIKELTAFLN